MANLTGNRGKFGLLELGGPLILQRCPQPLANSVAHVKRVVALENGCCEIWAETPKIH